MAKQQLNLELLLGKKVFARNGKSIGRLEEVCVELAPGECRVTEFLVGEYGVFSRLSAWSIARAVLGVFGPAFRSGHRIPWNKIDLTNPERPTLTCSVSEL